MRKGVFQKLSIAGNTKTTLPTPTIDNVLIVDDSQFQPIMQKMMFEFRMYYIKCNIKANLLAVLMTCELLIHMFIKESEA